MLFGCLAVWLAGCHLLAQRLVALPHNQHHRQQQQRQQHHCQQQQRQQRHCQQQQRQQQQKQSKP